MKYLKSRTKPDFKIALLTIALSVFGVVMIASSSVVVAYEKFGGTHDYYFVWRQIISLIIGLVLMLIFSAIDYQKYRKYSFWFLMVVLVLLIAVFLPVIGSMAKGAHRWINLGISFQPSELAKIALIVYMAAWLESREKDIHRFSKSIIPFVCILGLISLLIILEPDLGTLSIIILTSMAMFFAAGVPVTYFLFMAIFAGVVGTIFVRSSEYRWNRFLTFLNPGRDVLRHSYHISQAYIAVSQGGLWGLGFGNSIQKMRYLPEPHTDSIFAIISEELGFFRSSLVILAFIYFFILGLRVAKSAPDTFGRLLAIGITSSIVIQAFINMAAMLGLIPLTGVTLPFISYGGTSLVVSFVQIGILLNISRQVEHEG